MSHWYSAQFARVLFVALAVSGFVATLSLLVAYLLGLVAAAGAFALPIVVVLGSLYIARIPLENTPLWTVIPAGVAGKVVFKIVQRLHTRPVRTINAFRSCVPPGRSGFVSPQTTRRVPGRPFRGKYTVLN